MTPVEAVKLESELERPEIWSKYSVTFEVLKALESTSSPSSRAKATKLLLGQAEYFRRADTPGHDTWYKHALRAAALAAKRWCGVEDKD